MSTGLSSTTSAATAAVSPPAAAPTGPPPPAPPLWWKDFKNVLLVGCLTLIVIQFAIIFGMIARGPRDTAASTKNLDYLTLGEIRQIAAHLKEASMSLEPILDVRLASLKNELKTQYQSLEAEVKKIQGP